MPGGAKVTSIAALREFRPALIKFVEESRAALIAAEADASRTIDWLRREQAPFWKKEIRRRQDEITRCKTDLFNKQRSASGDPRSAVEERKALERAQRRLEDAQARAEHTSYWIRQLEKEHMAYKGTSQMLASQIITMEDKALYDLDRMAAALEEYVSINAPSVSELGAAPAPKGFAQAAGESFAQRDRAADAKPSPFAHYRQATPSAGRRRRAEPLAAIDPDWPRYELGRVERVQQIDAITPFLPPSKTPHGSWVRLSPGVLAAPRLYLERCTPADPEDSGWYLGPAPDNDRPEPERRELDRIRVSELLALRPDLETILSLPDGVLVLVLGGQIESLTLPNDTLGLAREDHT